jgi:hypothetical protein
LRHDQIGTGYGHATPAGEQALQSFAAAGLRLDTTYTAKAAAGLLDSAPAGMPLFWHTLSAVEPLELRRAGGAAMLPAPFTTVPGTGGTRGVKLRFLHRRLPVGPHGRMAPTPAGKRVFSSEIRPCGFVT